jgi:hypothetical protein
MDAPQVPFDSQAILGLDRHLAHPLPFSFAEKTVEACRPVPPLSEQTGPQHVRITEAVARIGLRSARKFAPVMSAAMPFAAQSRSGTGTLKPFSVVETSAYSPTR